MESNMPEKRPDGPTARKPKVFCCIFFAFALAACTGALGQAAQKQPVLGGPCAYESYPGAAEIMSVKELSPDEATGVRRFEVDFVFRPEKRAEGKSFTSSPGRQFPFLLEDSRYPDEKDLAMYGLEPGAKVKGVMKVIVKGTCTPVLFDFPKPER
jgi:hypothetical protein